MTRLKRETDLLYGEALYCLASLLNFLFCENAAEPLPWRSKLGRFSLPNCNLWSFSTCRFNMYRHGESWPELPNCICFEARAKKNKRWAKWQTEDPGLKEVSVKHLPCWRHRTGQLSHFLSLRLLCSWFVLLPGPLSKCSQRLLDFLKP